MRSGTHCPFDVESGTIVRGRRLEVVFIIGLSVSAARAQVPTERITLRSFDGRSEQAELGHLTVPAIRSSPAEKFDLAFYQLQAQRTESEVPIALEVVRRHPQSVRRMVLQGTVTPDGLIRLPLQVDEFFRQTAEEAKSQAAAKGLDPDLVSAFRKVREELQRGPLRFASRRKAEAKSL